MLDIGLQVQGVLVTARRQEVDFLNAGKSFDMLGMDLDNATIAHQQLTTLNLFPPDLHRVRYAFLGYGRWSVRVLQVPLDTPAGGGSLFP